MKLLIATEVRIYRYNGRFFNTGPFATILKRYFDAFGKIVLVTRVVETETKKDIFIDITDYLEDFIELKSLTDICRPGIIKKISESMKSCDLVITRIPSIISYKVCDIAKKSKKPYYAEVVACPWDAYWNYSLFGKFCAPFSMWFAKRSVRDANYALYVTNEFLQRRYPTKGKNIGCSDVALNDMFDDVIDSRLAKISKENDIVKLGTTAAVNVRYKGQQYIIKALGKLKKQGITKYRYEIVGAGDQSYLKSQIEKHNVADLVTFKGALTHDEVFRWLDSIDIYVQPSRQEGLPRALVEAMSRGLPAFGAKTGGIPELLDKRFIFSNTRKNLTEICNILSGFDTETMKQQAQRNFDVAKGYQKELLDAKRNEFFKCFREECLKND